MEIANGIFVLLLILVIYFAPTLVGWNKPNINSVIAVNLFLGWTFVGWVVALAMAVSSPKANHPPVIISSAKEDKLDKLKKLKELLDSGAITQQEYNSEKDNILGKKALTTEWKIKDE
jgi:hypothetical protein